MEIKLFSTSGNFGVEWTNRKPVSLFLGFHKITKQKTIKLKWKIFIIIKKTKKDFVLNEN